ncbi:MAG: hypothetical protein HY899_19555 [Deltaproteobacteria bacterium]|nr:hypothetical protein [Deltaproteobacteria bacterium]
MEITIYVSLFVLVIGTWIGPDFFSEVLAAGAQEGKAAWLVARVSAMVAGAGVAAGSVVGDGRRSAFEVAAREG